MSEPTALDPSGTAPKATTAPVGEPIIHVIGIGDDGPAGLAVCGRATIAAATLLCGGERHLAFFPEHCAERFVVRSNLDALVERLRHTTTPSRPVVLASGDPCFYGIGPYLARRLGRDRVSIQPTVSSVQLAFARLGESWHDALVLSAHGRPLAPLLPRAVVARKTVFLTDEHNTPGRIATALLDAGAADSPAHVFEHLGGSGERHTATRLTALRDSAFAPLNLLIVLRGTDAAPPPVAFGRPEAVYAHRDGQITKAEVRAVSLSKLRLRPGAVLWDVGAGSGSVSLEAAGLMPGGQVFAVERDAAQLALLRQNAAAYCSSGLAVSHGEAPAVLADLPDPDAVFLGGSGSKLARILACVVERLRPGGRLVANFATLEHLLEAQQTLRARRWETEIVELNVARGTSLVGLTRLEPLHPVFILTAWAPEPGAALP
jgi:precorrin-6B C5,15-methyltransferase / cobalt-precorrin-6B C5,C15-methyltransferase